MLKTAGLVFFSIQGSTEIGNEKAAKRIEGDKRTSKTAAKKEGAPKRCALQMQEVADKGSGWTAGFYEVRESKNILKHFKRVKTAIKRVIIFLIEKLYLAAMTTRIVCKQLSALAILLVVVIVIIIPPLPGLS